MKAVRKEKDRTSGSSSTLGSSANSGMLIMDMLDARRNCEHGDLMSCWLREKARAVIISTVDSHNIFCRLTVSG
jgi:hypothetical protein